MDSREHRGTGAVVSCPKVSVRPVFQQGGASVLDGSYPDAGSGRAVRTSRGWANRASLPSGAVQRCAFFSRPSMTSAL